MSNIIHKILSPIQALVLGFVLIILIGAILLWLPPSTVQGYSTTFLDALFTSASAVTTTGLVVVDTGSHYTPLGQVIILLLFQIGGLGYMLFIGFISFGLGTGFTVTGRLVFTESIARPSTVEIKKFIKAVFLYTAFFEIVGTIGLTLVFIEDAPLVDALYSGLFHSVSAFCTAGFSLNESSFIAYADNVWANGVVAFVTIGGGIGFFVLYDVAHVARRISFRRFPAGLSDHTKLVLLVTAVLMVSGTAAIFLFEGGDSGGHVADRILKASFQAISASSTTGFNSIDIGTMKSLSLFVIIILMFIGSSPGGTGGGIKTTSAGMIVLYIRSVLTNNPDISVFRRTIPSTTVHKAIGLALLAGMYLTVLIVILSISERAPLLPISFEAASALGTVGLSTGITPHLGPVGKVLIIFTMFVGRIGPLAIGHSLVGKTRTRTYAYPAGNVMVG